MLPTVYIETTIVSYLTARPSRDLVMAAHQQITQDWWANRRAEFALFISQFVFQEASMGDAAMAQERLAALRTIPLLDITQDAENLAKKLIAEGPIPKKAAVDAFAHRSGNSSWDGLSANMELQTHRQRRDADRRCRRVSRSRF